MTEHLGAPARSPLRRLPWHTVALLALALGLGALAPLPDPGAIPSAGPFAQLVLDRASPAEAWRWLTAHFIHVGTGHLLWNLAALALLGAVIEFGGRGARDLWPAVLTGALAVSLWFFLVDRSPFYCGLSGVLNTLLIVALARSHPPLAAQDRESGARGGAVTVLLWLIGAGAFAKAGYELWTGAALLTDHPWPAAPGAHLAGLTAGCALVAGRRFLTGHS